MHQEPKQVRKWTIISTSVPSFTAEILDQVIHVGSHYLSLLKKNLKPSDLLYSTVVDMAYYDSEVIIAEVRLAE